MAISQSINNSALLIIEKVLTIGMAFVTGVFLARIAGPKVFGEYSYILSFVGLFAPLCIMGLNNITTKYVVKYPNNSHHYIKSAVLIRFTGALMSVVLGLLFAFYFNEKHSLTLDIRNLLLLQGFQLFFVFEYYFLANNRVLPSLKIRLTILMLASLLKIVVIFNGADLSTLVMIHGGAYMFIALAYIVLYRKTNAHHKIKNQVNKRTLLSLFHKGKWLLLSGVAAVIYLKIDQIMLANMHSVEEVAFYAAAARLSEFWYVFPILIANAFNRQLIEKHKHNKNEFSHFSLSFLIVLVAGAILISVLTYVFSNLVIELIYGSKFKSSAAILNIHIFATIFIFQRAVFSKWLIIEGLYKYSLVTHGIGAIVNVILNLILIPKWAGVGAAWATLFSYMFAGYLSLYFSSQTRPFAQMMTKAMLKWPFHCKQAFIEVTSTQRATNKYE
jgi:PST family polysaccharide transporter